ncbi:MAG: hypothetical protein DRP67_00495 [Candidatus Omnitrophota bacterium]|nr:MAG: hypothetical protein DRP67_00495 [Candidatus Omnitrophota bacterium]
MRKIKIKLLFLFTIFPTICFSSTFKLLFQVRGNNKLVILVNGKEIYRKSINGSKWKETVKFNSPANKIVLVFKLINEKGGSLHIGNIRIYGDKGEMRFNGKWKSISSSPLFITYMWEGNELAYRRGIMLSPPKSERRIEGWCGYEFDGIVEPAVNLRLCRLFEYFGCWDELNYYDDYKNISFYPPEPSPGDRVKIKIKVENRGQKDAENCKVLLYDRGKKIGEKKITIKGGEKKEVSFVIDKIKEGIHFFSARVFPQEGEIETDKYDNFLLRPLVVGDEQKAHPYIYFPPEELEELRNGGYKKRFLYSYLRNSIRAKVSKYEELNGFHALNSALVWLIERIPQAKEKAIMFIKQAGKGWTGERLAGGPPEVAHGLMRYSIAFDMLADSLTPEQYNEIKKLLLNLLHRLCQNARTWYYGPKVPPCFPRPLRIHAYSQGRYIMHAGLSVSSLLLSGKGIKIEDSSPFNGIPEKYLHFSLGAFYNEVLHFMTSPDGYYREGMGYMSMAEDRTGALFYHTFYRAGHNLFELWPITRKMHLYPVLTRFPNGWIMPENDSSVCSFNLIFQTLYAPLYTSKHMKGIAKWAVENGPFKIGSNDFYKWLGANTVFSLFQLKDWKGENIKSEKPQWNPTVFLNDHLVFRNGWDRDSTYIMLQTKNWPSTSVSHDQFDQNQFIFFAKKAYLAIDPGYGTYPVRNWCRGKYKSHNMIEVDGEKPETRNDLGTSVFTYGESAFPENTASTPYLDIGESVIPKWEVKKKDGEWDLLSHRRTVIFPKQTDYFILVDSLKSLRNVNHKYSFILQGNTYNTYYSEKRPGDFSKNWRNAPLPDNLSVKKNVAEWKVKNEDGKDVRFRVYFVIPEKLKIEKHDGWLGYVTYRHGRNKFIEAKAEGKDMRYLVILYPDLLEDENDDGEIKVVDIKGENYGYATLFLKNGFVDYILSKDSEEESGKDLRSDGEIAFLREKDGNVNCFCFLRGKCIKFKGKNLVISDKKLDYCVVSIDGDKYILKASSEGKSKLIIVFEKNFKNVIRKSKNLKVNIIRNRAELEIEGKAELELSI